MPNFKPLKASSRIEPQNSSLVGAKENVRLLKLIRNEEQPKRYNHGGSLI